MQVARARNCRIAPLRLPPALCTNLHLTFIKMPVFMQSVFPAHTYVSQHGLPIRSAWECPLCASTRLTLGPVAAWG